MPAYLEAAQLKASGVEFVTVDCSDKYTVVAQCKAGTARQAAGQPKCMTREDYEKLQRLGLTNEMILGILGVMWVNTAMNFIVDALGVKRTEEIKELDLSLDRAI